MEVFRSVVDNQELEQFSKEKFEADSDTIKIVPLYAGPAMPGWLPIATAPKDERVLVCGYTGRGYYCTDAKLVDGMWLLFDPAMDDYVAESSGHTHWQPLPTPPEVQS